MARTFPWISPRRVPSVPSYQNLGPKLTSCCLKRYGCSASAAETAARDERLAAGGANRIVHQLGSSSVGCSGSKRELCPLQRKGRKALMRREVESLRPPIFAGTFPVGH